MFMTASAPFPVSPPIPTIVVEGSTLFVSKALRLKRVAVITEAPLTTALVTPPISALESNTVTAIIPPAPPSVDGVAVDKLSASTSTDPAAMRVAPSITASTSPPMTVVELAPAPAPPIDISTEAAVAVDVIVGSE